ncbi:MAG: aminoacyl-tRNA hydrolase [Candidatus Vogelbacteria bacterium CG10_big_fil_rev_8_21_14_0_10_51_16]|uniref:Peptidyl-tRNA hydrolase n=1 Tax=Candidatus Vogelbacteria bacterium CG10_big_fil_rev_8_21_14_0_10_51_16 TaxID=1975045 RepID=A0A2H0RES6_9BACT|nr:MAG: aminoacyl-tRNA hydrolase [Candidatus Vogelbacteria bacterium CG10_big_fil_rev_8_21_14_0_10_51_16]
MIYCISMKYTIIGLGNPGEEYVNTRHNVGRMVVERYAKISGASVWKFDKNKKATVSKTKTGRNEATLVLPESFMNNSGGVVKQFMTSPKMTERAVVVYDDIDLPLGVIKIAFNRGSGGHRGLESVIKSLRTRDFVRIRVGIASTTPTGKIKKPKGEEAVIKHILSKIRAKDEMLFKKVVSRAAKAVEQVVTHGHAKAASLNEF